MEDDALDDIVDLEVLPPLLRVQQHQLRLGEIELAGAQKSAAQRGQPASARAPSTPRPDAPSRARAHT